MKRVGLVLLCIISVYVQKVSGNTPLEGKKNLYPSAFIANVGDSNYSINDILNGNVSLHFRSLKEISPNLGFTSDHYWVYFSIHNSQKDAVSYYLETARPITDHVDLYTVLADRSYTVQHSGDDMPFSERSFQHRKTLFKLDIPAGATRKMYVHLKSDGEVISLPLVLHTSESLLEETYLEQLVFGFFYGILLLAAITYMFFYVALRERSFLFYAIYVISVAALQFSLDGFFYQYISPSGNVFALKAVIVSALLSTLFFGKYVSAFLGIKEHFKLASKVFIGIYAIILVLLALAIIVSNVIAISYPLANLLGLIILFLVLLFIVKTYIERFPVDTFFVMGMVFMVLGFVTFILNNFGLVANSFIVQNSPKLGTGMEIIFLSLSMANRFRKIKSEKEQMQSLALKRSEEMNELKSYFMSNMSHELRTPLNAIMGMADMLSKDATDVKTRSNIEIIKYASIGLLSSVNDILDFSKIERGELQLEKTEFEPGKVFEQLKNNAENHAKDKGLIFNYEVEGDITEVSVIGDAMRLGQIVNNVLSNAIKFTPEGWVNFKISKQVVNHNQLIITITITDSGVGIPKEKIDSIFDSFTQESINNKRKFGGLGLGLCIVKKLIDLHGGTVDIESVQNVGTTCVIELSYELVKKKEIIITEYPDNEKNLLGASILIVEDNSINQLIIKTVMRAWKNAELHFANNGVEAIEVLRNRHFDLVLMDLQMPVMDGYEATISIRDGNAGEQNVNIPIIALTADTMESTRYKVKEIGMDDYLSKPIDYSLLYKSITRLLSARKNNDITTFQRKNIQYQP